MPKLHPHDHIYLEARIATDGPLPGRDRILGLEARAVNGSDGRLLGEFHGNLTNGEQATAIAYRAFIDALPHRPVFVNRHSPFDHLWSRCLLLRHGGGDPCGFQALDVASRTIALARSLPWDDAIFVSVDVEANGPLPGTNALMSIGAAAFDLDRNIIGRFSANLLPMPGTVSDPDTDAFWARNPEAFAATQTDRREPGEAMASYRAFLEGLPGRPVFTGYPAAFDFMWHNFYLVAHGGDDPCAGRVLDIKTYAAAMLGCAFRSAVKGNFPRAWYEGAPPHDHIALTDAIGQGVLGVNMVRHNLGLAPAAPSLVTGVRP